ncbi:ATP-binding cassette, subfamily F, uup [Hydrocarboniphaga daqingensis]|jgi:ATP-binding cassette subfamily F protein uup|uniref:ATP-binding protein Uup n=1 Tax=Hydrocarboniphaga daqingensis TaxID=490188 RepID=A0A1M5MRM0_9GAMM|nr:ATP-binding cassette domain-containing protein [Hydrocarboniphaga daqingensis]SHG79958.1 ATP-binding cassette, subfamily F, uup [Hydrocarboniphaga daqingensis]
MLLTLRDVSLNLGSTVLLDHAAFSIDKGERVAIIGRNGAGKSTLMKVIDGVVAIDSGEIVRAQSLRIARLVQDVPAGTDGSVFQVIAQGLGTAGALLARYHELLAAERYDELGDVQSKLEAVDGWTLDQRVSETISRLDLPGEAIFSSLSGGLKRRVLLGQALVQQPDLLLLDEPTNHLDVESIAWLEEFLVGYPGAILFVTHDRAFLQRLATRILELDRGWLTSWPGDYDNYLRRKEERLHAESQERALFDKRLAQEEAWIRKGVEARRTRNQGRVERLMQLRQQFSQRRNAPGQARMLIQEADRSGKLVAEADNVAYSYGERPIVRGLTTTIIRGDKLGIIGPNGAGKTTMINLLLGRLQPQSGAMKLGANLQIAYFDQLRGGLDENASVVDNLGDGKDYVEIGGARKHVMGYLQDFLFTPDRARSPVRALSGGERNRLLLAKLFAVPSNLLVLDEPTNDLDMETLELLEELLMDYEGTVLLVSHDRAFLDNVVTRCLVFEGGGRVNEYIGGYQDWVRQRPASALRASSGGSNNNAGSKPAAAPAVAAKLTIARALNAKERRELEELPARIEKLEAEQATLADELSAPGFYDRPKDQVLKVQKRLDELARTLATAYARWEELEALK